MNDDGAATCAGFTYQTRFRMTDSVLASPTGQPPTCHPYFSK